MRRCAFHPVSPASFYEIKCNPQFHAVRVQLIGWTFYFERRSSPPKSLFPWQQPSIGPPLDPREPQIPGRADSCKDTRDWEQP